MNEDILTLQQWIYLELYKQSIGHALLWEQGFQDNIIQMTDEAEVLKRVNLFWHIQLAKCPADLFEARNFLSDDITIKVWKQRFLMKVLPSIIRHIKI